MVTQRDAATSLRLVSGAYREPPTRVARCGGFLALRRLRSSFVRAGAKRLMARRPWTSPSGAFLCPRARRSATLRELRGGSHWAIRRERVPSRACARSALRERVALTSWLGAGACKLLLCALSVLLSSSAWVYDFPADEHRLQLIRNATKYNDVPRLRELLSAGAPEEAATEIAVALLTAAKENKVPALKQLLVLRNKFEIRDIRDNGLTPLLLAAMHEHCEVVQLLLSHNAAYARAQVNVADDRGRTVLSWAAANGNLECARALLNAGAEPNQYNVKGHTALHLAAGVANIELVKVLLRKGAAINTAGEDGFTPLHIAVLSDSYAVAELLLRRGADVDARYNGSTALHIAADKGFVDVARLLLRYGAAFDGHADSTGFTALDYAVENDNDAMVEALLEEAASLTKTQARLDMLVQAGNTFFVAVHCWICYRSVLWRLRPRRAVPTRQGRGMPARAARKAWSLHWRFLKLLLQCLKCAVAAAWSLVWRWPALLACAVWALLRLPRRAPPDPPPASPVTQPPTTVRGVRRRRQPRRVTDQATPADDTARAAGAARAETRSDDGAAEEDADATVMQQTADETAALAAAEAAASAAAAEQAKAAAAAKRAAEAAAAKEATKAAAQQQRALEEAATEEAQAVAAKAARAAADAAAAAEETAAAAARVQALEAAAAAEKAAAESVAPPPVGDHPPAAAAEAPLPPPPPVLKECCVCLSGMPTSELLVIGPCGHRCLCSECWQNLQPPAARRCSICSVVATTAMRVYEAWA